MPISNYLHFDAHRFVKEHPKRLEKIRELTERLADVLDESGDPLAEKVTRSANDSPTERAAEKRAKIQAQIDDLEAIEELYHSALKILSEDELKALTLFYSLQPWVFIHRMGREGYGRTKAYELRRSALDKIRSYLTSLMA